MIALSHKPFGILASVLDAVEAVRGRAGAASSACATGARPGSTEPRHTF